jgi:hypothetical protein
MNDLNARPLATMRLQLHTPDNVETLEFWLVENDFGISVDVQAVEKTDLYIDALTLNQAEQLRDFLVYATEAARRDLNETQRAEAACAP